MIRGTLGSPETRPTFDITGSLPTGTFFASEWDTGTGTGNAAVQDTGRTRSWSLRNDTAGFEVRTTATDSRDYPTTEYLRVTNNAAQTVLAFQGSDSYLTAPAINDSIWLRHYYRLTQSGTAGDSHGFYFDDDWSGGTNWGPNVLGFYITGVDSSTFRFRLSTGDDQGAQRYWTVTTNETTLNKDQTYRFNYRFTRTGTLTYTVGFWVYLANDTLLYETSDFTDDNAFGGTGSNNLSTFEFTTTEARIATMGPWQLGIEESQGSGAYCEFAGVLLTAGASAADPGAWTNAEAAFTT